MGVTWAVSNPQAGSLTLSDCHQICGDRGSVVGTDDNPWRGAVAAPLLH